MYTDLPLMQLLYIFQNISLETSDLIVNETFGLSKLLQGRQRKLEVNNDTFYYIYTVDHSASGHGNLVALTAGWSY